MCTLLTRNLNARNKLQQKIFLDENNDSIKDVLKTRYKSQSSESSLDEGNFSAHESEEEPQETTQIFLFRDKGRFSGRSPGIRVKAPSNKTPQRAGNRSRIPNRSQPLKAINGSVNRHLDCGSSHLSWIKGHLAFSKGSLLSFLLVLTQYRKFCAEYGKKPLKAAQFARTIRKSCRFPTLSLKHVARKRTFINLKLLAPPSDEVPIQKKLCQEQRNEIEDIISTPKKDKKLVSNERPHADSALKSFDKDCPENVDSDDSGFDSSEPYGEKLVIDEAQDDVSQSSNNNYISENQESELIKPIPTNPILELSSNESSTSEQHVAPFLPEPLAQGPCTDVQIKIEVQEAEEDVTPQQKLSRAMSQQLTFEETKNTKCSQDGNALVAIFKQMVETNLLSTFLTMFGHSVSCTKEKCSKLCQMFRRIRHHLTSKNHQCPILFIYGQILKLHLDFCITPTCGLHNCKSLKKIRKQNILIKSQSQ